MRRSIVLGMVVAALALTSAPGAAADQPCSRYAATPQRVFHGDDFEHVHAAASAMYCPDDVYVRITACVEVASAEGWTAVGCETSPGTYVTSHTRAGRGQALTFDVPCVSGSLRTHVWGGEGLEPTEWVSDTATIACFGGGPPPGPPPSPTPDPTPSPTPDPTPSPTPDPTPSPSPAPGSTPASTPGSSGGRADSAPRAAIPDTTAPVVVIGARRHVKATRAGVVRLGIGPLAEDASAGVALTRRGRVLGRTALLVRAGQAVTARIRLSSQDRAALRRRGTMRVRAVVVLQDPAGNTGVAAVGLTLRAA